MTTWRKEIKDCFECTGDTWDDVVECTLSQAQLDKRFDNGFGGTGGEPFTIWTKEYVYFPVEYDGAAWVGYVSRNPNGEPTAHQGSG